MKLTREQWAIEIEEPIIADYVKKYSPEEHTIGVWSELEGLKHETGSQLQEWLGHRFAELWINYKLG